MSTLLSHSCRIGDDVPVDVLDRGAGPLLAAARRERGWSQIQAARRLAAAAQARGVAAASPASLKTQLSRWENGHTQPDEQYRTLLAELYGRDRRELGLVAGPDREGTAGQADTLRGKLAAADAVDDAAIGLLREQLETARRLDRRLGAAAVLGAVRGQLSHLEWTLAHTVESARRVPLAALLAETAALAGSQALDTGSVAQSWEHFETAKAAAREAGSPALLGHALAEQAEVLLDLGDTTAAVQVVEYATEVTGRAPAPLLAWLAARRGAALASAGDADGTRRALAAAERHLRLDIQHPALGFLEVDAAALHRWRGHALSLLADPDAVADLRHAVGTGADAGGAVREQAGARVDLVAALTAADRPAEAAEQARLAGALTMRIGSSRLRQRLEGVLPGVTRS